MREGLREERTLWVTDQIALDNFPEDLNAFYLLKNPPSEEKPPAEEEAGKKGKVRGVCAFTLHPTYIPLRIRNTADICVKFRRQRLRMFKAVPQKHKTLLTPFALVRASANHPTG